MLIIRGVLQRLFRGYIGIMENRMETTMLGFRLRGFKGKLYIRGYMVCDAILDFCDPDQGKVMLVCKELQGLFPDDGNSDDVSDSEDDGAAALRRKKRAARKAVKQREKPQKKKKPARSDGRAKMDSEDVNMEEDRRRENKDKSARNAMNAMRKASRRDPGEDSNAAGSNAPEMSDAEDAKGKRKKPKKKAAKSRAVMSSRDKDSKEAKTPKDRSRAEPALEDDPPELAGGKPEIGL